MSVLVKSMEMPENCILCPLNDTAGCGITEKIMTTKEMRKGRASDCPLVEAPTPHGRLIDADDVLTQTQKGKCENSFEMGKEYGWNKAIEYVGNFAPTVIEAEVEE